MCLLFAETVRGSEMQLIPISDGSDGDLPPFPVASVRFEGDQPAAPLQNFGHFGRVLSAPDGVGSAFVDVSQTNDAPAPIVLQPVQQPQCLRRRC